MRTFAFIFLITTGAVARTDFWAPVVPPRAHYSIDARFVADASRLEGTETIRFRNDTRQPIGRIALEWYGEILHVRANGVPANPSPGKYSIALFDLPNDVAPGTEIELLIDFGARWKLDPHSASAITSFVSPHLWWGIGTLDDYEVRLQVPDGYGVATSGRYDPRTRRYRGEGLRAFGLFIGKGYESEEADAGDVHIRAMFRAADRPRVELLLTTAVDVVGFYRQQFGFYPQRSLSIVPGTGAYPAASGLSVIGEEGPSEDPEWFWRWLTAHEIGHMYWGDYVLGQGPDSLTWLMIGLGIHADHEYARARDIKGIRGGMEQGYVTAAKQGFDTTMDLTEKQRAANHLDYNTYNNAVQHGKSAALLNALESVVGVETFAAIYRHCLKGYAGKQLGWREFQRISEIESGQDLDWFFEAWVRSSDTADYRVAGKQCLPAGAVYNCSVSVERLGEIRMPVTLAARFEDGSEQRVRTERLADLEELNFQTKSPLKEVVIEPDATVALAEVPSPSQREFIGKVNQMPWTGVREKALDAYRQARELKIADNATLFKLGLLLYDSRYYQDSLAAMTQVPGADPGWGFAATVWRGHLLDLLGRRAEAVACYREALKATWTRPMRHDQYNIVVNKEWVEERLKTPFERE
jgi:tetratricopeptide (TPR) repeat protein